jgi:hypothetical protein
LACLAASGKSAKPVSDFVIFQREMDGHGGASHSIRALNVNETDYAFPRIFTIECLIYE